MNIENKTKNTLEEYVKQNPLTASEQAEYFNRENEAKRDAEAEKHIKALDDQLK